MAVRRPLIFLNGVPAELPFSDKVAGTCELLLSTLTPADGKLIGVVAIAAGSTILTSYQQAGSPLPPAFTAGDVGKAIKVAGAGTGQGAGNDLVTTIASVDSATQVTLAAPAQQTIVRENGFGAILGTDCGVGLQAALDLLAPTGGTIVFDGVFLWSTPVSRDGANVRLVSADPSSGLLVAGDLQKTMATLNNGAVLIERAYFAGCPGAINDCFELFDFNATTARIISSGFFGLSVRSAVGGALIAHRRGDFEMIENEFGGCIGESGNGISVVDVDEFQSFTTRYNKFIDYGLFLGHLHSKTGIGFTLAWVRVRSPLGPPTNASVNRGSVVRMQDDRFDEGHYLAVMIQPDLGRPTIRHVHLAGLRINNSILDGGSAIQIARVEDVVIEQPSIGWANVPRNGIVLESCGNVTIDSPYITAGGPGAGTGMPDGLIASNVRSLTMKNASVIARRSLTNVGRVVEMVDGMGGVLPLSKYGRVTDADFRSPPPLGTVAADVLNRRLYLRCADGWFATPMLEANTDPTDPLVNVTPATATLPTATQYRRSADSGLFGTATAHVFKDFDGFRMRVKLVDLVGDAIVGTTTVRQQAGRNDINPALIVQSGGNVVLINGAAQGSGTTAASGDILELTYQRSTNKVRVLKNGVLTAETEAHPSVNGLSARHFAETIATKNMTIELLEWSPL